MAKYRKYDWPTLIAEFKESGLTQSAFCEARALNPKYFNQRFKAITQAQSGFTKASLQAPALGGMVIEYGRCRIHCSPQASALDVVQLIKGLA